MKKWIVKIIGTLLAITMIITASPQGLLGKISTNTVEAATGVKKPASVADSTMNAKQKVTWSCIWFGYYPQTEIVDTANTCGTYGKSWKKESDYEVNADLYAQLQNATYTNGDTTIGNVKYRRIRRYDATYCLTTGLRYNNYNWDTNYHYFRYEPIKWRVLDLINGNVVLLSDIVLDDMDYNINSGEMVWENSTIRSWLNAYDSSKNTAGNDYSTKGFLQRAFNSDEQKMIYNKSLVHYSSLVYGTNGSLSSGSGNTYDKLYLLTEEDVFDEEDKAGRHGFSLDKDILDEGRRCQSSTFAKAMGVYSYTNSSYSGNCDWWLRAPGSGLSGGYSSEAAYIKYDGSLGSIEVNKSTVGVRPALYLSLSNTDLYSYAGTVCNDGTVNEVEHNHSWDEGVITTQPTCTTEGTKTYTCPCGKTKTETLAALGHSWDKGVITTQPTCTAEGTKTYSCPCGKTKTETLAALGHSWDKGVITTQPGYTETGIKTYTCSVCKDTRTEIIPKLEKKAVTITASNISKTYATKTQYFSIVAKSSQGTSLTYVSNNKNITVNKTTGKVTVKAKYIGTATITISSAETNATKAAIKKITVTVLPTKTTLSSAANMKGKKIKVSWKKNIVGNGYQIQYSTNSKFSSGNKVVTIKKNSTMAATISKLVKGKTYYVRIRTYKTVSGKNYYSGWSTVKKVKITK